MFTNHKADTGATAAKERFVRSLPVRRCDGQWQHRSHRGHHVISDAAQEFCVAIWENDLASDVPTKLVDLFH